MSLMTLQTVAPLADTTSTASESCDNDYCRLCATKTAPERLQSFSAASAASDTLLTAIRRLNSDVQRGDGLPQAACAECVRLLEAVEVIVRRIVNAQKVLTGLYQRQPSGEENVTDASRHDTNRECGDTSDSSDRLGSDHHSDDSEIGDTTVNTEESQRETDRIRNVKCRKKTEMGRSTRAQTKKKKRKSGQSSATLPLYNNIPTGDRTTNQVTAESDTMQVRASKLQMLPRYNNMPTTTDDDDAPIKSEDPAILRWSNFLCCKRCDHRPQSLQQLREHSWQTHNRCVVFKCVTCPGQIVSYKRFFRHLIRHHSTLEQCCEFCDQCFVSASEVRFHKELEHSDEAKPHQCNSCGTTFDTANELQSHRDAFVIVKAKVAGDRRFKCERCDKEFLNNITLQSHMESHDPTKNRCTVCNKAYKNKYNLKQHISFVHNPQSQFICQICGKGFKRGAMLKEHIDVHKGIRPFSCSICDKKFSKSAALKAHQVTHSGLRPCVCKVCGKSFKFKSGLNLHLNSHKNVKPYSCEPCVKSFQNWSNYNKHMKRIHDKNMSSWQLVDRC